MPIDTSPETPQSTGVAVHTLALPEPGDLDGLGESVAPSLFTGGAGLSIPLRLPAARGVAPALSLDYSAGGDNGPFGMGFDVAVPRISVRTSTGVPGYAGSDRYVSSAAGELTRAAGSGDGAEIVYLPRHEHDFDRIVQLPAAGGTSAWKIVDREDVATLFGRTGDARIADPDAPARIAAWLIEETLDSRGNRCRYRYKPEDRANLPPDVFEVDRGPPSQRYLERISYGHYLDAGAELAAFEIVFDYGEYDLSDLDRPGSHPYQPVRPWATRADPFSSYRTGFEVRTERLCRNILVFHRFAELGAEPCLVRAYRLIYDETPLAAFLIRIIEVGYRRRADGSYESAELPPLELGYSRFAPSATPAFEPLVVDGLGAALPGYLAAPDLAPIDLDGAGLPGLLDTAGPAIRYHAPLGGGGFAAAQPLPLPASGAPEPPMLVIEDLEGNGRYAVVVQDPSQAGYYARTADGWSAFQPFAAAPSFPPGAELHAASLGGTGRADLFYFDGNDIVTFASLGTDGYAAPCRLALPDGFPVAAEGGSDEILAFADVFGDGLAHRIRLRDGSLEVWPSLGHGRFAPRVQFAGVPRFGPGIDASRIYLAGVAGTGGVDLVYAYHDHVEIHLNRSGNSFSAPHRIDLPRPLTDIDQLDIADVLGSGAPSLVLTRIEPVVEHLHAPLGSVAPGTGAPSVQPWQLERIDNHRGALTTLRYASSTEFALADARAGRPWVTRLPTPVAVIAEIATSDAIGQIRMVQSFRYRDGYYDPVLREFRGFAMVEHRDSETWEELVARGAAADALAAPRHVPPTTTRTWFFTGALDDAAIAAQVARAFFHGDPDAFPPPRTVLDPDIARAGAETVAAAYRALAGQIIRQEVYSDEPPAERAGVPFTVTEHAHQVRLIQPDRGALRSSVFVHPRETLSYHYDRRAGDPAIQHDVVLAVDGYGSVTRSATVHYPRRATGDPDTVIYPEQTELRGIVELARFTEVTAPFRRLGVRCEQRGAELGGLDLGTARYFTWDAIAAEVERALAHPIAYGTAFTPGVLQSRTYQWRRSYFWNADQTECLPLGEITARALPHHEDRAVFSDAWLAATYGDKVDGALLAREAGYVADGDGTWWNRGLATDYHRPDEPHAFYLPRRTAFLEPPPDRPRPIDSLRLETEFAYDAYFLHVIASRETVEAGVTEDTRARIDYQTLLAAEVIDLNETRHQALYDPLGRVIAISVFKPAHGAWPRRGDGDLDDPADFARRPGATFADVLARQPHYLQQATTFAFYRAAAWDLDRQPPSMIVLRRQTHVSDLPPGAHGAIAAQVSYHDGLGRALELRREVEPEPGRQAPRWRVTGLTLYNNKGLPGAQYLPSYADTPRYQPPDPSGIPPTVTHYDALERPIRVDDPKGLFSRTTYTAWEEHRFDRNDTVREAPYYREFMASYPAHPTVAQRDEKAALDQAARDYNTPRIEVFDSAGNSIRVIHDNLGDVRPEAFRAIVEGTPVTAEELWRDVRAHGYLVTRTEAPIGTWVTGKFRPYTPGFVLELGPDFARFAPAVTELLRQGGLVTCLHTDLQGRQHTSIDPRLYYHNLTRGTDDANFRHAFAMESDQPLRTIGADAGTRWLLRNLYDHPVVTWDDRGIRSHTTFDRLQRTVGVAIDHGGTRYLAEVRRYGDTVADGAERNLRGELHEHEDQSGVRVYHAYDLEDEATEITRQFAEDYRGPIDWSQPVRLHPRPWITRRAHDATGALIREVSDDGSELRRRYFASGRLASLHAITAAGDELDLVRGVAWSAANRPLEIAFAGGVTAVRGYESTTLRLLHLRSTGPGGAPLQDVDTTYDPVGHITMVRDRTATHLFDYPQPEAANERRYDPLYRLVHATGREHPGITATTHIDGFKQSIYADLSPSDPSQRVALAEYVETYRYDDARNLVELAHRVPLAQPGEDFVRVQPVVADSNRLAGQRYDGDGNPETLTLDAPVALAWDYRNLLAHTGRYAAPGGARADHHVYDADGTRVRRITEWFDAGGAPVRTDEQIYLGAYQVGLTQAPGGAAEVTLRTLRAVAGLRALSVVETGPDGALLRVRSQLIDDLRSIAVETDGDGLPLSYEVYFPFGGTSVIAGRSQAAVEPKVHRYTGKIADDGLGIYDYGARYYAPWLSRWLNPDSAGPVDGLNLFELVRDDPTTYIDLDGHVAIFTRRRGRRGQLPIVHINVTGVLVDNTTRRYGRKKLSAYAQRIKSQIERSYSGTGTTIRYTTTATIRTDGTINPDDHVFRIVDSGKLPKRFSKGQRYRAGNFKRPSVRGFAPRSRLRGGRTQGNKVVYLDRALIASPPVGLTPTHSGLSVTNKATLDRTAPHEFGHTMNLNHPSSVQPLNLMNQSKPSNQPGLQITEQQVLQMEQDFKNGRLNGSDQGVDPRTLR